MKINKDYLTVMREGKRILHGNIPSNDQIEPTSNIGTFILCACILAVIIYLLLIPGCAYSATLDQWANAIHKAEGNNNYGILKHYKHTSYRQACKNTVWHRWCIYKNKGLKSGFTAYLGATYAPIGAFNDPQGLNLNWIRNVNYWLERGNL